MPGYYKRTKQQLEKLMTELPTYKKSPYAGMQLGAANNILNSAMPGQAQFGRNILSSQGSSLDFIGKNATDASQALSLAAGAGARTDQQFADQSSQYFREGRFVARNAVAAYAHGHFIFGRFCAANDLRCVGHLRATHHCGD